MTDLGIAGVASDRMVTAAGYHGPDIGYGRRRCERSGKKQ